MSDDEAEEIDREDNNDWIKYYGNKPEYSISRSKIFVENRIELLESKIDRVTREKEVLDKKYEAICVRDNEIHENIIKEAERMKRKRERDDAEKAKKVQMRMLDVWLVANKQPMSLQHEDYARNRINRGDTFENCLISYNNYLEEQKNKNKNKRQKMNITD